MATGSFTLSTDNRMVFHDITGRLTKELNQAGITEGVLVVFNPHTTAGLTINEGADPAVQDDILSVLTTVIPRHNHPYKHQEGNSPAHVMASLMGSSVTVLVENGCPKLGTWQKIFFCEFDGPRTRKVWWRLS